MTLRSAIAVINRALDAGEVDQARADDLRALAGRINNSGRSNVGGRPRKRYTCAQCGEVVEGDQAMREHRRSHRQAA